MKKVLITGATSGIGYELAKIFDRNGYKLILLGRNNKKLKELRKKYPKAIVIKKDLSKPKAAEQIYKKVRKVNVLVNNAGFGEHGSFKDMKNETNMINVNVTALTQLTKLFLQKMKRGDKILNVASMAGFVPGPYMAVYYATKAYVINFSESLHEELMDKGITVTALCPGGTKTEFHERADMEDTKVAQNRMSASDVAEEGYNGMIAGKRIVVPGFMNKINMILIKFMPRSIMAKIVKSIQDDSKRN